MRFVIGQLLCKVGMHLWAKGWAEYPVHDPAFGWVAIPYQPCMRLWDWGCMAERTDLASHPPVPMSEPPVQGVAHRIVD